MTLSAILQRIVAILDEASIPYMLTGSLAAAFYATPRATQDIDLVLEISPEQVGMLTAQLQSAGLYVSSDAAQEAIRLEGQFNAIDPDTGWKVDFIVRKSRAFSIKEFGRRQSQNVLGMDLFLVSPEDLIIAKLEWARKGQSELQLKDVQGILRNSESDLNRTYVEHWIGELGLTEIWKTALEALDSEPGNSER